MQVIEAQGSASRSPSIAPVLGDGRPLTLKDAVQRACAVRHYSRKTFEAYWHWIRLFVHFHGRRPPREMAAPEVGAFLSWLATERKVSASTQRQALAGVLFLYQKVYELDIGWVDNIVKAKQPRRLPTVLTVDETRAVLSHTSGTPGLFPASGCAMWEREPGADDEAGAPPGYLGCQPGVFPPARPA